MLEVQLANSLVAYCIVAHIVACCLTLRACLSVVEGEKATPRCWSDEEVVVTGGLMENGWLENIRGREEEEEEVEKEIEEILDMEYASLNWLRFRKISKKNNDMLQSYFWTIYTSVKNNPELKQ